MAHPLFIDQLSNLVEGARLEQQASGFHGPNTKLLGHLLDLMFDKIPQDPGGSQYRQGKTLGADYTHWYRAKTGGGRIRLFYRFNSTARIILYAWVNDENTLRSYGKRDDAYAVFAKMLNAGNPPNDWNDLVTAAVSVAPLHRRYSRRIDPDRSS